MKKPSRHESRVRVSVCTGNELVMIVERAEQSVLHNRVRHLKAQFKL